MNDQVNSIEKLRNTLNRGGLGIGGTCVRMEDDLCGRLVGSNGEMAVVRDRDNEVEIVDISELQPIGEQPKNDWPAPTLESLDRLDNLLRAEFGLWSCDMAGSIEDKEYSRRAVYLRDHILKEIAVLCTETMWPDAADQDDAPAQPVKAGASVLVEDAGLQIPGKVVEVCRSGAFVALDPKHTADGTRGFLWEFIHVQAGSAATAG